MKFKLGELFCGPGGLALGAALAESVCSSRGENFSIIPIWGVDSDPAAIASYNHNIVAEYGGNGINVDAAEFCDKHITAYKKINALAFGFPCNDFSLVGKRRGVNGQYGKLYKAGIIALNKMKPHWFIAENVSGIHSANQGEAFKTIVNDLEEAGGKGYRITAHLYKFEEYGVPQYRHRMILVGIRKDKRLTFRVPTPTTRKGKYITAAQALKGIEPGAPNSEIHKPAPRIEWRLKFTPPWKNSWYLDELLDMPPTERQNILKNDLPWYQRELSHLSDRKIKKMIDDCRLKCQKARMSHIYRRLSAGEPSYTVTGSGGGGTHVYHWEEHRPLTNRERARLQSFPDWFEFKGSKQQVRKQIGMAVPPTGAKIIFEAILKTFARIDYDSIESNCKAVNSF